MPDEFTNMFIIVIFWFGVQLIIDIKVYNVYLITFFKNFGHERQTGSLVGFQLSWGHVNLYGLAKKTPLKPLNVLNLMY